MAKKVIVYRFEVEKIDKATKFPISDISKKTAIALKHAMVASGMSVKAYVQAEPEIIE